MATRMGFPLPELPLKYDEAIRWLEQFDFYASAANLSNKKATFLAFCGDSAFDLLRNLLSPTNLSDGLVVFDTAKSGEKSIKAYILSHLQPKKILHYERFRLFTCLQRHRTIHQYVAELRRLASSCELGDILDDILLTIFIVGLSNSKLRERL